MQYEVVSNNDTGQSTVVAFFPDESEPLVSATSDHPHFSSIVRGLKADDHSVYGLFDIQVGINRKFVELGSNRYTVKNGVFYRDLDPMHNALADQVIRFMDDGVDDWRPLIRFFERVDANPSQKSREDLYDWISAGKLTITNDGMCVGYKSMNLQQDGKYTSTVAGPAVVDGVDHDPTKYVPNNPGSIVEMPRSKVDPNSKAHCSVGLHVGTWNYAKDYAGGRHIMKVTFDPADAVAVPTDDAGKIRVCRYVVADITRSAHEGALVPAQDYYTRSEAQTDDEYYDDVDAPDNF